MKKIPFLSFFGMTKELTALSSYISITDDRAAVIENCKQIVECSEIMAKVLTGSFEIEIWGSGLTMSNFCSDSSGDKRKNRVGQACVKKYQGERIMIFGYIDYVITGDSFTKFFRRIMSDKLPVSKMCEKNGKLTLRMPAEHCKALERLCDELGLEYTATKRHGSFVLAKRFSEEEDLS